MKWLPLFWILLIWDSTADTIETKNVLVSEPIQLDWQHDESLSPIQINFYSEKTGEKQALGRWTLKEDFTPDPFYSTNVEFRKSKGKIVFILTNPITEDYDATYFCEVTYDSDKNTLRQILVKLIDPKWTQDTEHLNLNVGKNATFVYEMNYRYSPSAVLFHKYNTEKDEENDIGYMLGTHTIVEDRFKEKVTFNQKTVEKMTTITFTIQDIKPTDEGVYSCTVIFTDGRLSNKAFKHMTVHSTSSQTLNEDNDELNSNNFASKIAMDFYILHINVITCFILYIVG